MTFAAEGEEAGDQVTERQTGAEAQTDALVQCSGQALAQHAGDPGSLLSSHLQEKRP